MPFFPKNRVSKVQLKTRLTKLIDSLSRKEPRSLNGRDVTLEIASMASKKCSRRALDMNVNSIQTTVGQQKHRAEQQ